MLDWSLFWACIVCTSVLVGCGGARPDAQPAGSRAGPPEATVPVVQRLRVEVRVDPTLARSPEHLTRVRGIVSEASAHLRRRFGLTLTVSAVRPWRSPARRDLAPMLAALEGTDPGEAHLVIGFTGGRPPRRPRMPDLVASRYAGRFMVVRTLATLFDRQPEAQRAAEVFLVVHGVAQIFGALPACGPAVMSPTPSFGAGAQMWQFVAANLALVRLHAAVDLRTGTVPPEVAARAAAVLSPPGRLRCHPEALRRRSALLQALAHPEQRQPPEPVHAAPDPRLVAGQAALARGDHPAAFAACAPLAEADPGGPAARCAGLSAAALGRHTEAARFLRAFLGHAGAGDGEVTLALAKTLGRAGDDGAARALLAGYVARHPEDLRAQINLGVAAARLGDFEAAREAWQAVLARDPDHADARALLDQLP